MPVEQQGEILGISPRPFDQIGVRQARTERHGGGPFQGSSVARLSHKSGNEFTERLPTARQARVKAKSARAKIRRRAREDFVREIVYWVPTVAGR
ncbi:hypothetical protein [Streptosporangium saharense]|uniref:Uncharacterized protein n=1 Tax=Streptosporangium saharense TaxID=1706840 RepID=A0A7W7QJS6_9ACTN|nr:hypothetical protein [Streptosporangium saharense]MBB4914902.1 hypothetical protein [Streptosporangium saharense]